MNNLLLIEILPCIIGLILTISILMRMRLFSSSGMFFKDIDDIDDDGKKNIVQIGGVSIFPILLIALCLSLGVPKLMGYDTLSTTEVEKSSLRIMQVIAGCSLLYIVGLKNDINGTGLHAKFAALLVASMMFPATNLWILDFQGVFGINEVPAYIGMPLTVMLVMFLTETVTLLDDIDGVGAGLVAIMAVLYFGFCIAGEFVLGALVSSAALGVVLPYTYFKLLLKDWNKTLMGNSGSYVMGYVISYMTLSLMQQSGYSMPHGMLMIVIGIILVPMLDVIRMLRLRIREGRAILTPDRNQMQHRFIRMGVPPALSAVCIILLVLFFAAVNGIWVIKEMNLTILALLDIILWSVMQLGFSYCISKYENKNRKKAWVMTYGRKAWEANPPVDKIKQKRMNFGTMGLPKHVILGDEVDFIPDGMNSFERNTKRLFDMLSSAIMLVITSPLFLLCYILIKMDDGGPVIYSQERIGRFGRPFTIHKFRSMHIDAEKSGPELSHAHGETDPRLTKIGSFLRAHHLDELPQLWDVFVGDMAFIGYRPERKFFIDKIMEHDPRYVFLYQIRPGVTSYATLYNGYTDTIEKMLRRLSLDLYYLEHRSFWFDFRILWLTFISILFGKKF